jgi:hypothetical protein
MATAAICLGLLTYRTLALLDDVRLELKATAAVMRAAPDRLTAAARDELDTTRRETLAEARRQGDLLRNQLDTRLASIEAKADTHAGALVGSVSTVAGQYGALADRYRAIPDQAAYANRWLWDCGHYSACLQSQTLALTGSARVTLGSVARAAPSVAASVQKSSEAFAAGFPRIVDNTDGVLDNVRRLTKPHWYDRLINGGITAGIFAIGR